MKRCPKCGLTKGLDKFYIDRSTKSGHRSHCKSCTSEKEKTRIRHRSNEEIDRHKLWAKANRKILQAKAYQRAKALGHKYVKAWRAKNKSRVRLWQAQQGAKRRAAHAMASPKWSIRFFVSEAYQLAKLRSKITNIEWHVDHIVPLQSKLVCGLHAHTNIQIIPARSNQAKANRNWPDMPC